MESLFVDFDPKPKVPTAKLIERLEAANWKRTEQTQGPMDYDLQFRKDNARPTIKTLTSHRRTHAMYAWEQPPPEPE